MEENFKLNMESIKTKCINELEAIYHSNPSKGKIIDAFENNFWQGEPIDEQEEAIERWIMKGIVEEFIEFTKQ